MGIPNYVQEMDGLRLKSWFTEISQKLNSDNFASGSFTPNITGLIGSPTITGNWFKLSTFLSLTVIVNGTSQTVSSKIDNLPFTARNYSVAVIYNSSTPALVGHGYVDNATQDLYLPNWNVTTNNIIVSCNYQISGL